MSSIWITGTALKEFPLMPKTDVTENKSSYLWTFCTNTCRNTKSEKKRWITLKKTYIYVNKSFEKSCNFYSSLGCYRDTVFSEICTSILKVMAMSLLISGQIFLPHDCLTKRPTAIQIIIQNIVFCKPFSQFFAWSWDKVMDRVSQP